MIDYAPDPVGRAAAGGGKGAGSSAGRSRRRPGKAPSAASALDRVTASLPGGGEARLGQRRMAEAVAAAIGSGRHLVVQAGTGTGKGLAYLVPAVLSGKKVVVATATKTLQDQLARHDLPLVQRTLGVPFDFAVLKGRSNYLCRQRAAEIQLTGADRPGEGAAGQEAEDDAGGLAGEAPAATGAPSSLAREVQRLIAWAQRSPSGERSDLDFEPSGRAWGLLSVSGPECPGRQRCPAGAECFAEAARDRAAEAKVVVVNMHLYAAHLARERGVLPEHDVVVFDEAHELEDVATAGLGLELGGGRVRALARGARSLLGEPDAAAAARLMEAGDGLDALLSPRVGQRLPRGLGDDLVSALALTAERLRALSGALRQPRVGQATLGEEGGQADLSDPARARALLAAGGLAEDLHALEEAGEDQVAWVEERPGGSPALRLAPIEVGPLLAERLWGEVTAVLTSATIPQGLPDRLALPAGRHDDLDVGSPFPYATHGLLYCAAHLPDRRRPGAEEAANRELVGLVRAAGGRTLALFTSWRAMKEAARTVKEKVPFRVLCQDDMPKPALLAAFAEEESSCLFATMGFWQGVDLPGRTLSLVVIDRIPFARPDDPLMSARRERAGAAAFRVVDLPRAGMLLAQGAGRLIRTSSDRGVVAVLDRRLAHSSYRWDLVRALPPMARTRHREEVERFLAEAIGPEAARGP